MVKHFGFWTLVIGLAFVSCNQRNQTNTTEKAQEQIQLLIRDVLKWANSASSIDLLPTLTDNEGRTYIGLDLEKHKQNLTTLSKTGYFDTEFIDNYDQIILTIDKGLRNNEYEEWLVGDLPTFRFANDYDPWWNGQESFPLDFISIETIKITNDNGEFYFTCASQCEGLEYFKTRFRAIQENNMWKISYLEGFDLKESLKRDGEQ